MTMLEGIVKTSMNKVFPLVLATLLYALPVNSSYAEPLEKQKKDQTVSYTISLKVFEGMLNQRLDKTKGGYGGGLGSVSAGIRYNPYGISLAAYIANDMRVVEDGEIEGIDSDQDNKIILGDGEAGLSLSYDEFSQENLAFSVQVLSGVTKARHAQEQHGTYYAKNELKLIWRPLMEEDNSLLSADFSPFLSVSHYFSLQGDRDGLKGDYPIVSIGLIVHEQIFNK
ncbi:hypothetical protein ACFL0W_03550 [Nanoarchaeota archaeon]